MQRRNAIPRNEREAQARERALAALALMRREKLSLKAASKAQETDPRTVRRYVGSALRQDGPRSRYKPTPYDRLARTLNVVTLQGPQSVVVRDSRVATKIAQFMNSVKEYLKIGDSSILKPFRGKSFRASGVSYQFITDPDALEQLADAGVLAIEQLYRAAQGMTG